MKLRIATLLLAAWLPEAVAQAPAKKAEPAKPVNAHDPLPIMHWDTSSIQALGTIVSTRYDQAKNQVTWVIETKKFVHPGRISPIARDDEGHKVATCPDLEFTLLPRKKNDTMERVQVLLKLPGKEAMKEAWQIRLFKIAQPRPVEDSEK
jgi:hypothetical protein